MRLNKPCYDHVPNDGEFYKMFHVYKGTNKNYTLFAPYRGKDNAYPMNIKLRASDYWEYFDDEKLYYRTTSGTYPNGFHGYKKLVDARKLQDTSYLGSRSRSGVFKCKYHNVLAQDKDVIVAEYMEIIEEVKNDAS